MTKRFIKEYIDSPATGGGLFFLVVGAVLARASMTLDPWWMGYLQGLSTTVIGLSLGTLILQLLLDLQRASIGDRLRETREWALATPLRQAIPFLENWIPSCNASDLDPIQIRQLNAAVKYIEKLHNSASLLSLEVNDPAYRRDLEAFMASAERVAASITDLAESIDKRTFAKQLQKNLDDTHGAVQAFQEQAARILSRISHADDSMSERQ